MFELITFDSWSENFSFKTNMLRKFELEFELNGIWIVWNLNWMEYLPAVPNVLNLNIWLTSTTYYSVLLLMSPRWPVTLQNLWQLTTDHVFYLLTRVHGISLWPSWLIWKPWNMFCKDCNYIWITYCMPRILRYVMR